MEPIMFHRMYLPAPSGLVHPERGLVVVRGGGRKLVAFSLWAAFCPLVVVRPLVLGSSVPCDFGSLQAGEEKRLPRIARRGRSLLATGLQRPPVNTDSR